MASIKLKLKPSCTPGEGILYYQLTHKGVVRRVSTGFRIFVSEWNGQSYAVGTKSTDSYRAAYLKAVNKRLLHDRALLLHIMASLESSGRPYTADDLVQTYNLRTKEQSFLYFMKDIITQLAAAGKARTSRAYTSALRSFSMFLDGSDLIFDSINQSLIMRYESWLKGRGVTLNTVSFYMRILRAVYNRAVERGMTEQQTPFRHVYTGIGNTRKRAIPLRAIKAIKELDLSKDPLLDYTRDLFLFSFYTRGMSFIDMAYLKRSDIKEGFLLYRRRKTGQMLRIRWEKSMQDIVEKYARGNESDCSYLLPIITDVTRDDRLQYESALHLVNKKLKEIAGRAGLSFNLTTYVCRHSWATAAKNMKIPLTVISEGMGHNSERTTQIYLDSLDTSVVDRANRLILRKLA